MLFEVRGNAVRARDADGKEIECLLKPFVRLGATEAEEAAACLSETFASQAGDSEFVVGSLEEIEREAVAGDAEPVADRSDVREDVERRGGVERMEAVQLVEAVRQEFDLLAELLHDRVAFSGVSFESRLTGELHQRRSTRQRGVDHLANRVGNLD